MTARDRRFGTVVLTGATSGIGAAVAAVLAARAHMLVLLGPESTEAVAAQLKELRGRRGAEIHHVSCDFTQLAAVTTAAATVAALAPGGIDLLINDAAVPGSPARILTSDGFERTLQVNALAPALLTRLLVPFLATHARIVNVASSAHRVERFHFDDVDLEREYSPVAAYARAKLAMLTWSSLLAEEEAATSTTVVALCPGLTDTPLTAAMLWRGAGEARRGPGRRPRAGRRQRARGPVRRCRATARRTRRSR